MEACAGREPPFLPAAVQLFPPCTRVFWFRVFFGRLWLRSYDFLTTSFHFLAFVLRFVLLFPFVRGAGSHPFGAVTISDEQRVPLLGSKEATSVLKSTQGPVAFAATRP